MDRVLIAVDDSVESLAAARRGAQLAAGWQSTVRLITVVADGAVEATTETTPEARRAEATKLLDHVIRDVRAAGVEPHKVDVVVRFGEPFRQILEEAHTWHADLIVVAVSRRVGLRSPYVGSQTEHVLEFAECPVLVVPGAQRNG
jgi:nucleotide-binding universal stress UspA family protein